MSFVVCMVSLLLLLRLLLLLLLLLLTGALLHLHGVRSRVPQLWPFHGSHWTKIVARPESRLPKGTSRCALPCSPKPRALRALPDSSGQEVVKGTPVSRS